MHTTFRTDDPEINPYRLLTALVVPRAIAWVSTVSKEGVANLAPHSFFTIASSRPPIVCFASVGHKDTLRNVLETREFVVNVANRRQMDQVNQTSARFEPDISEAEVCGIEMTPSAFVTPARVTGSPASIECTLHSTYDVGNSVMIFGDVVGINVSNDVLEDGHPEFKLLDVVSRLGRDEWGFGTDVVSVPRPR